MSQAFASIDIPAPAAQVWRLIGGFNSLPNWIPSISSSELSEGGRVRHLVTPNGMTIIERLIALDDASRSYTYTIVRAPFPVDDYLSTLHVRGTNDGQASRVEWSGQFTPQGVSDTEASRIFQNLYESNLKALAENFASRQAPSRITT